jgi:SET domain-containing protein
VRAKNSINKIFSYYECHPFCGCNKDHCQNFLIESKNNKNYARQIRRVKKNNVVMWGMFAMEEIPQGAFFCEYKGEIVTKK